MKYGDVNYTLEKHLKNICDENYQYMDLFATWEIDKKVYKSMLQGVSYNFIQYSMHDSSHSKSIISKIEMVLGSDRIQLLGATETWMILECAYLHDCGMILKNEDIEEIWKNEIFQDFLKDMASGTDRDLKEAAEYILNFKKLIDEDKVTKNWPVKIRRFTVEIIAAYFRGKHPEKSKEYINDFNNVWGVDLTHSGLIKSRLIRLVGDIAFLHGQDFKSVMDLEYISDGLKTDYIHPRFVAEMIRLGDLLDLDNSRFNETLIKNFGELPKLSKYHLGKHGAIIHMLVTPEKIDVSANCKKDGEVRETRKWFDWLRDEVNNLTINWRSIVPEDFTGTAPQIGELNILKNGEKIDATTGNLKLEIPRKRVFEILEGAGIYKRKLDFLRELIQNALDASKIQLWRDINSRIYDPWITTNVELKDLTPFDIDEKVYNNYKIMVKVDYIEDKKVRITVKDRGIGINQESLLNMANVGQSWNKRDNFKKELKDMPSWLKPTGGFGIGIQSCFRVTDEINIRTKTYDNNDGIKINIESGKEEGYITSEIDKDANFNRGSEVIVDVPENLETGYNIPGYVAEKMENYDSFMDKNETFLWIITEYIDNEFENSLFELELIYKDKVEKYYKSIIQHYSRVFQNESYKLTNKYLFDFDKQNLNKSYLWDKQYSTFIEIELLPIDEYNHNLSEFYFKGVKTTNILYRLGINVCRIMCNVNGMNTIETLTLNREEIREEAENIILNMLKSAIEFIAHEYKERIEKNSDFIKGNNINAFSLKILLDICNINDDDTNQKLIDNCNEKIIVLEKDENGFDEKHVSIKEVFKNNKVTLIDIMEDSYMNEYETIYNIKTMVNSRNLKYNYILIDKRLVRIIRRNYYKNDFKVTEITDSHGRENIKIYDYYLNIRRTSCAMKIDYSYRRDFLKKLTNNFSKRSAIIVLEGYENLSVKKLPGELFRQSYITVIGNLYAIISPITREDYKEIKDGVTKSLIKDKISKRDDFKKLVDYVFKNRADSNRASKEEIVSDYMKLIDEYCGLIEEDSKESK